MASLCLLAKQESAMNIRYLIIGLVVAVIALVIIMSRPFQSTVVEEDPGQPPPHAIDQ